MMESTEVEVQEIRSVTVPKGQDIWKAQAQQALAQAKSLKVVDNVSYVAIGESRDTWAARAKGLLALLNPGCQAADKLHSDLVKDRNGCVTPYEEAAKIAKALLIAYDQEEDRKRRLEQARLDAVAKKKAEDDALELAATLEAAGATEAAAEILEEPIQPTTTILPKSTPKIVGFSYRRIYDAKVIDRKMFLLAVINGTIPDEAWQPNETFLRQQAGAMKTALNYPGVELTWKDV